VSRYEQELHARVEGQVLACIGCNDCLLACPLPESRSVTIGELNQAVHLPVITAANVRGFLNACTQCEQCVPACPADLNRAEMVLLNKLKVEDTAPDHELMLQARTGLVPSRWGLDQLAASLTELELFSGVASPALRRLLLKSTLRLLQPGEPLCQEGEFHERLCVVLSGSVEQISRGARGEVIPILALGPGGFFGEIGVLNAGPEPFGAQAREVSVVLEAPRVAVHRLIEQAPAFSETLYGVYARRALWSYARSPAALGGLPEQAVQELLEGTRLELAPPGKVVFEQGSPPADFFLVKSGFLRARRADGATSRVLSYFHEGNLFGLLALLNREPGHPYAVDAATRAELIRIPSASLGRVLARYPDAVRALWSAAAESENLVRSQDVGKLTVFKSSHGEPEQRLSAEVLVEKGIAHGKEVLVIDQTRCVGCKNCISACERRHGYSRLQLRGIQVEQYLFPTACRHCEDPACLLCAVNGIVRLPSGEIKIVEENCIGCGACAQRCPYGNISMHPVDQKRRGGLFGLFDLLRGSPARQRMLDELDPKVRRLAVKCDLCAGHDDYACVTACPVAAAFRIDPGTSLRS
jgi:Fe-S-cluster-containing hydrogenase component 2